MRGFDLLTSDTSHFEKCSRTATYGRRSRHFFLPLFGLALVLLACQAAAEQTQAEQSKAVQPAQTPLQAPQPGKTTKARKPLDSCELKNAGASMTATAGMRVLAVAGLIPGAPAEGTSAVQARVCVTHAPIINWYARFVTGPDVMPFSPVQKLRLAADNLINPFNLLTIAGVAGISVAADSHSTYGPGLPGWGRNVGVAFTQDMTGQFFGTFVIPSITHTDPHYHRRPDLSIPRRALLCVYQVFWQRADNGRRTFNYSEIIGPIVDMSFTNLYVPGQETHFSADAVRYGVDLGTAPIDNLITEFVPSIAAHIHTHVVFVQRIVNHVATTGNVP
jgi:hypothetical protein